MSNEKALLEFALKNDPTLAAKFAKFEGKAAFNVAIEKAVQNYLGGNETPSSKVVLAEVTAAFVEAKAAKSGGKRHRVTVTDEIRAKVKELKEQGKGALTISKEIAISTPTVYNILKK